MPYMTKQRTVNGRVERLCRYCEAWWPLEKFVRSTTPSVHNGRLAKCKMCSNDERDVRRGRAS